MHVRLHTYVRTYMHTHIHTCTRVNIHTCAYTMIYVSLHVVKFIRKFAIVVSPLYPQDSKHDLFIYGGHVAWNKVGR
jgi:hypothetical protein